LAGLATGVWQGRDDIAENWMEDRRFESKTGEASSRWREWNRAVERAKRWVEE
jgi:glycerol kinase